MFALSMDLRQRVVAAVDAGMTQQQAAERFAVSVSSVERLVARRADSARASAASGPAVEATSLSATSATRPRAPGGAAGWAAWIRRGWCSSMSAARIPR
jgi:orotate phosphoribosyltransferase-like protein